MPQNDKFIIAVDFDGTIIDHCYPDIGEPLLDSIYYLKKFQDLGAKLILWTMRSGNKLQAAVDLCLSHGIVFWGINSNPEQSDWTDSTTKQFAHLYIDDAAFGCPKLRGKSNRPVADWSRIGPQVIQILLDQGKVRGEKFVSQPIEIEAIQYVGKNIDEICKFSGARLVDGRLFIDTLLIDIDDWVIKGTEGEFSPCKPIVFAKKYRRK